MIALAAGSVTEVADIARGVDAAVVEGYPAGAAAGVGVAA